MKTNFCTGTGTGTTLFAPPSRLTDEELLLAYRSTGDTEMFSRLVHRYEQELYSYLRRFLADATLAEDVFQTTFLQVHLKSHQFQEGRKVRPWLYTIATHQAIDTQRRMRRHRSVSLDRQNKVDSGKNDTLMELLESQEPGPTARLNEIERREWVQNAMRKLPEQVMHAVNLVYFQGMKYREAAEVLSIPVGTVKSRLHSAILKLNESWTESHFSGVEQAHA